MTANRSAVIAYVLAGRTVDTCNRQRAAEDTFKMTMQGYWDCGGRLWRWASHAHAGCPVISAYVPEAQMVQSDCDVASVYLPMSQSIQSAEPAVS